jgi:hypothetical protein
MKISEFLFTIENEFTLNDLQDLVEKLSTSTFESFKILEDDGYIFIRGCREATDEEKETILLAQEKERELIRQNQEREQQRIEKILLENPGLEYSIETLKPKLTLLEEQRQALALSMTAPLGNFAKDDQIVSWVDLNKTGENQ